MRAARSASASVSSTGSPPPTGSACSRHGRRGWRSVPVAQHQRVKRGHRFQRAGRGQGQVGLTLGQHLPGDQVPAPHKPAPVDIRIGGHGGTGAQHLRRQRQQAEPRQWKPGGKAGSCRPSFCLARMALELCLFSGTLIITQAARAMSASRAPAPRTGGTQHPSARENRAGIRQPGLAMTPMGRRAAISRQWLQRSNCTMLSAPSNEQSARAGKAVAARRWCRRSCACQARPRCR